MSFVSALEDANSMACTVVRRLIQRLKIDEYKIGRIEIATETLSDKSKSTKTVLMRMFKNKNIEGVTNLNACYGGTAALINCINYGNSEGKDKYSIVITSDIAVYDNI
jgi:hydroxymethylglutaryl-CoA synthase